MKIMSLRNPLRKMSKNEPEGCLNLLDDTETVKRKIMKAPTTIAGVINLVNIAFGVEAYDTGIGLLRTLLIEHPELKDRHLRCYSNHNKLTGVELI